MNTLTFEEIRGNVDAQRLNLLPEIFARAQYALAKNGWKIHANRVHYTRPGKELQTKKYSAVFAPWPNPEDLPHFTVFSASSDIAPFVQKRAYLPVEILCLLQFRGNYLQCVGELASEYPEPDDEEF